MWPTATTTAYVKLPLDHEQTPMTNVSIIHRGMIKTARWIFGVILILAALIEPAVANPSFQQGRKYLDLMEDARALTQFTKALQWPANTRRERAKILLYLGITQCNLLNKKSAEQSFEKALDEDPLAALPKVTSPDITELFNRVRAARREPLDKSTPEQGSPPEQGSLEGASSGTGGDIQDSPTRTNWPAWTCLGLGVAAGAAGITLGLMARAEDQQAQDLALSTPEAQRHYDTGQGQAVAAYILFAAAGATLVTSGVLFYLGRSRGRPTSAAVVPTKTGLMLQMGGYIW